MWIKNACDWIVNNGDVIRNYAVAIGAIAIAIAEVVYTVKAKIVKIKNEELRSDNDANMKRVETEINNKVSENLSEHYAKIQGLIDEQTKIIGAKQKEIAEAKQKEVEDNVLKMNAEIELLKSIKNGGANDEK